jgi:ComF family protein
MRAMRVALDLVFPPACTFCGAWLDSIRHEPMLCIECLRALTCDSELPRCGRCGCHLPPRKIGQPQCPDCSRTRFQFRTVIPLGIYRDTLRTAVIRIKNFHEYPLARSVGRLLADCVAPRLAGDGPDVVLPIPKFWLKRLFRGTHSSEFLANEVARSMNLPCFARALRWKRLIEKQSLLSVTDRRRNVRGALELAREYDFRDSHVLLVDDTMTTGATANEAARVLLRGGVRCVCVAVVGRAPSRLILLPDRVTQVAEISRGLADHPRLAVEPFPLNNSEVD